MLPICAQSSVPGSLTPGGAIDLTMVSNLETRMGMCNERCKFTDCQYATLLMNGTCLLRRNPHTGVDGLGLSNDLVTQACFKPYGR
jgi:hypothetical protein